MDRFYSYKETCMGALFLYPALKETLWGGTKLIEQYKFNTKGQNIAEAWMLSCHKDGESLILNGEFKGQPLSSYITNMGKGCLGKKAIDFSDFPILIKLIDAKETLSIQVHPDNEYARENENDNGKTEAWYILDSNTDSKLIFGLKEKLTKQQLRNKVEDGSFIDYVNECKVKKGDVAFIKSGTLHAIGAGIFLAEVQQSSNTTYRVYDYKRKDKNGNERELHIERAIDVINTEPIKADFSPLGEKTKKDGYYYTDLTTCEYFNMKLIEVFESVTIESTEASFVSIIVLEGSGKLLCSNEQFDIKKGASIFIPANEGKHILQGDMKLLETTL